MLPLFDFNISALLPVKKVNIFFSLQVSNYWFIRLSFADRSTIVTDIIFFISLALANFFHKASISFRTSIEDNLQVDQIQDIFIRCFLTLLNAVIFNCFHVCNASQFVEPHLSHSFSLSFIVVLASNSYWVD